MDLWMEWCITVLLLNIKPTWVKGQNEIPPLQTRRLSHTNQNHHESSRKPSKQAAHGGGGIFKHEDLVSFVQMVVDEPRDQLLVGGRDRLYRLHLDNLRELQVSNWPSTDSRKNTCMQRGNREEECHNFIRVLTVSENGEVFVCGTDAFHPNCTYRDATNFDVVKESKDGLGVCPYSPRYYATALRTENGDVYAATFIKSDASDAAISRRLGPSKNLRTLRRNSRWLEEPNFVSAYEIGNYVYFFFREIAQENINCGNVIFSRVARVCKYDDGGSGHLRDAWSSYQKARLNCSLPGEFPFYFDELQSTFYSEDEQRFYALFTTPTNGIAGSAVCVFDLKAIEHAFDGPWKYWERSSYAWLVSQETGSQLTCVSGSSGKQGAFVDTSKYQLMDRAVQSREGAPIIMRENERWTHVVVDHIVTKRHEVDMVFLATEEGKVRKMVRVPKTDQTCLVEEIKTVENGLHRPVTNMKLAGFKSAIYLATPGYIVKVPVERCARHRSALECLNAQDPYCGWNSLTSTCGTPPQGNVHSKNWDQNFSQCPVLDYPVNGRWSDWSEWEQCQQVGLDPKLDQSCLCRSRACDRPRPANGGQECMGASMEVMDCTENPIEEKSTRLVLFLVPPIVLLVAIVFYLLYPRRGQQTEGEENRKLTATQETEELVQVNGKEEEAPIGAGKEEPAEPLSDPV